MEFLRVEEIRIFHIGIKDYKVSYFKKPFHFFNQRIMCEIFSCHVYELQMQNISVDGYFGFCDNIKRKNYRLCWEDSTRGHHKSLYQVQEPHGLHYLSIQILTKGVWLFSFQEESHCTATVEHLSMLSKINIFHSNILNMT